VTSVGIIGNGYVGGAIAAYFDKREGIDVFVSDVDPDRARNTFIEAAFANFIFVCVPTPTNDYGDQDLEALKSVCHKLQILANVHKKTLGPVIVKSTVLPGTCRSLSETFAPDLPIIFWPEFLTARTAEADFAVQVGSIILGGEGRVLSHVVDFLSRFWWSVSRYSWEEAEMIKYVRNTFYALKVAHFNEIKRLCDATELDYDTMVGGALAGGWINPMHTKVPGPDGKLGFGGACLPKDSEALVRYALRTTGLPILTAALKSNKEIRDE